MGAFTGAAGSLTGVATSLIGNPNVGGGGRSSYLIDNFSASDMITPRAGGNINSGNYSRTAPLGTLSIGGGQINSGSTMPKLRTIKNY